MPALTQNQQILSYLKSGKKLTPKGHAIITDYVTRNGKTFAEYSLLQ